MIAQLLHGCKPINKLTVGMLSIMDDYGSAWFAGAAAVLQ